MAIIKQGASIVSTPAKQDGLKGIMSMELTRLSGKARYCIKHLIIADIFSGSGFNEIDGVQINGSPISILDSLLNTVTQNHTFKVSLYFSDIVAERATITLANEIEQWCYINKIIRKDNYLIINGKPIELVLMGNSAEQSCLLISHILKDGHHVRLFIDPNGPKDFPWEMVSKMYADHGKYQLSITSHLSATTLKRVSHAGLTTNIPKNMSLALKEIQGIKNSDGWIREGLGPDQWTIAYIPPYGFSPKGDWKKRGYYKINSREGKAILLNLSHTKKELKNGIIGYGQQLSLF